MEPHVANHVVTFGDMLIRYELYFATLGKIMHNNRTSSQTINHHANAIWRRRRAR